VPTDRPEPKPLFDTRRLRAAMGKAGLEGIVAHSRPNYFYLTGFQSLDYVIDVSSVNYVVIPAGDDNPPVAIIPRWESMTLHDRPIWIATKEYAGEYYIKDEPILKGTVFVNTWDALVHALASAGLGKAQVGFELDLLPVSTYRRIVSAFPTMEIIDASTLLRSLRMVKTSEEVRRIRRACEISEQATNEAIRGLRPNMTERELAQSIACKVIEQGATVLYVELATGAAAGQHLPTDRRINKGDIIRTDVAAIFEGYNSDIGRTFSVGKPTQEQARIYQVAYQSIQAGLAAIKPGTRAKDIFAECMAVWKEAGFTDVRRHHTGHGIGLEAHEAPAFKPDNETRIEPGMVLAVEAPYYIYPVGGFAPEDILVVGPDGNTQFTHAPAEL